MPARARNARIATPAKRVLPVAPATFAAFAGVIAIGDAAAAAAASGVPASAVGAVAASPDAASAPPEEEDVVCGPAASPAREDDAAPPAAAAGPPTVAGAPVFVVAAVDVPLFLERDEPDDFVVGDVLRCEDGRVAAGLEVLELWVGLAAAGAVLDGPELDGAEADGAEADGLELDGLVVVVPWDDPAFCCLSQVSYELIRAHSVHCAVATSSLPS